MIIYKGDYVIFILPFLKYRLMDTLCAPSLLYTMLNAYNIHVACEMIDACYSIKSICWLFAMRLIAID